MPNDWIIDVISDLKCFANNNGLPALAQQLDDAVLIAAMEIASNKGGVSDGNNVTSGPIGGVLRQVAARQRA